MRLEAQADRGVVPEGSRREGGQSGVRLSVVLRASAQARPFGPAGVNTARHNVHRPARRRSRSARPQARQAARCESSGRSVVRRGKAKVGRRQALLQGRPACRTCGSSRSSRADPTIMICIHARTHESGLCFVVEAPDRILRVLFSSESVRSNQGAREHRPVKSCVKWLLERRRAPVGHLPVALAAMGRSQQAGSLSGSRRGPCCRGGTGL